MLDIHFVIRGLAEERPIFNSEADFQLALGWALQNASPSTRVRLEYRPAFLDRRGYLDVWAELDDQAVAIELKYFTRALDVTVGQERFELLNHGAQDINRYDFVRDVARVESVVALRPQVAGYAIALTNDSSYWRPPTSPRSTVDRAFRIHEGGLLTGELGWATSAGPGTVRGRERAHVLVQSHEIHWRDYSHVADGPAGTFRYLAVEATSRQSHG